MRLLHRLVSFLHSTPFVGADVYRDVTINTTTPIHTGEQIYLRENFKELIETKAVNVLGPDPMDVGGLFEMKWIAEYADMHGLQFAPHGTADGAFPEEQTLGCWFALNLSYR